MMDKIGGDRTSQLYGGLLTFLRKCLFKVMSVGPIPNHIAFIMDGNRRYAKKQNSGEGAGHRAGYSSLMSLLRYCYELGVKYVTVYAFSIDNFRRRPEEVKYVMDLMIEKIEELLKEESIVGQYGIRVYFIGNLKLLSEPVRFAAEKAMKATAKNNKAILLVCVAYTSCDEIMHAVQESCKLKRKEIQMLLESQVRGGSTVGFRQQKKISDLVVHDIQESYEDGLHGSEARHLLEGSYEDNSDDIARTCDCLIEEVEVCEKEMKASSIELVDVEKHMYMAVAPDPDILIRSSGETRLSNFLLWQTTNCLLYSPAALWPELGMWHLVWAVLNFQQSYQYLEKKRKTM
ncbi:dehydrodolichyl diphosphate synthase 6-like isoform X2 [Morus notabilis]|nr:dehydrodolichyl diphosphate synthase 6-like isoform X2 [Morus notabilis]